MAIDQKISDYFASHQTLWLNAAFRVLTNLGSGAVWISVYALVLVFLRERFGKLLYTFILAEVIGLAMIVVLRYITRRDRPTKRYKCFFLTPWNKYSFPSHHALRSFLIAVVLGTAHPRLLPLLLFAASVICFTRLYLSKHYLSDVVVGALIGTLLGIQLSKLLF